MSFRRGFLLKIGKSKKAKEAKGSIDRSIRQQRTADVSHAAFLKEFPRDPPGRRDVLAWMHRLPIMIIRISMAGFGSLCQRYRS